MLHINDAMVDRLVSADEALESMREAFKAFGSGEAAMQQRERTDAGGVKLSTLGAVIPSQGVAGAKVYTTIGGRFNFVILLFSSQTGEPLATMEANAITRLRTAATSLLAAEQLAPQGAQSLFLCGAGVQGLAHARQFAKHFPLRQITVYDPFAGEDLATRLARETGVATKRVSDTQAVGESEIVITASRAVEPLFPGARIASGAFVAAIGSSLPHTRELDDAALSRASTIVVEWRRQSLQEAGDLVLADPALEVASKVVELGDLVCGRFKRQPAGDGISLYKAVGVGLEDIALAGLAYRKHLEAMA
ncbi:MAG: ornithine cyclodeaminase family protein [Proteobacteria bacterium]|nr:ornithine cyclodeaminase family protein [Pseudomonadota bacterium]